MEKKSFWSLRKVITFGFIGLILLLYLYPYIIDTIMCHYLATHKFNNEPSDRGTFGDMYGALNSFLSGLAVLGIVLTLFWEKKVQEDKEERTEKDKLIYLLKVFNIIIETTESFKDRLNANCYAISKDPSQVPALTDDVKRYITKTITQINKHEEYFLAYRHIFKKSDILEAFSTCIYIDDAITSYLKLYGESYTKYIDKHSKYLTDCMDIIVQLSQIAKSETYRNSLVELEVIRLELEKIMLNSSPLDIQKQIVSNLYTYFNKYYTDSQFKGIKNKIEALFEVDKSYEGIVDLFKREANLLDAPIKYLREFTKELEKIDNNIIQN